jgi:hypothetical protein
MDAKGWPLGDPDGSVHYFGYGYRSIPLSMRLSFSRWGTFADLSRTFAREESPTVFGPVTAPGYSQHR